MQNEPKGPQAARWRKRKHEALRGLKLPAEALPGSLSLTHRRCGKPNCRCAKGEGHPVWQLTFMAEGRKRVEQVPEDWVEEVQRRVAEGRAFKDAVAEALVANAELLALRRKQRRRG